MTPRRVDILAVASPGRTDATASVPHRSPFPVIIGRTPVRQRHGDDLPGAGPSHPCISSFVLYLAIPAHNEVATIGVLLWRLRTVLAEFPREYEVVVYDDASTDDTAAVAEQYERAMPVSVLRGGTHLGYAGAVDALLRHVSARTRYPRRDAVLLLQGDFTDPPVVVPEFARRFEGGADLVVGERLTVADAPTAVKRLFKYGHWAMRPFVKVEGVSDLTASMRLVRISALREAIRVAGSSPLLSGDSWTANADLLLRLAPHARRVESVPLEPTFGVRMRETRRVAMRDTLATLQWAWGARGRRAVVGSSPAESGPDERRSPRQGSRRRDEPELSVERIREKVRERDGSSGIDGEAPEPRRRGRERDRERPREEGRAERTERAERPARGEREGREKRGAEAGSVERSAERPERTREPRESREPRERTRAPRGERAEREGRDGRDAALRSATGRGAEARGTRRREDPRNPLTDPTLELDDPFAAPASRRAAPPLDVPAPEAAPEAAAEATVETSAPAAEARPSATPAPTPADSGRPAELARPQMDDDIGGADRAEALPRADRALSDAEEDLERDADDAAGDDERAEGGADGEGRRKRRRNRRSRRGRRKTGAGAEGEGDRDADREAEGPADASSGGEDTSGHAGEARRVGDREAVRFTVGDHVDGEPVAPRTVGGDDEDDDADGGDDEDVAGLESMSEGAPRPRRRGRRGRRGGARRSRGRKERGEGDSPAPAEE